MSRNLEEKYRVNPTYIQHDYLGERPVRYTWFSCQVRQQLAKKMIEPLP